MPLSLTEKEGFRHLMHVVESRYQPPGRTKVTKLMEQKYETLSDITKQQLSQVPYMASLTTDHWSEMYNQNSFMAITAHIIDEKSNQLKSMILGKNFL